MILSQVAEDMPYWSERSPMAFVRVSPKVEYRYMVEDMFNFDYKFAKFNIQIRESFELLILQI